MDFFTLILICHIIAGFTSLLLGTFILIRKKGDSIHKKLGKIFSIAMVANGLFAFVLSYLHPNLFLFIVGVFSIYLTVTGYRAVGLKNINTGEKPKVFDYVLTVLMCIASITFLYLGIYYLIQGEIFGIVFCFFGLISFRLCYVDYKRYRNTSEPDKLQWLKNHLGRMTGAYIAAFTAFLVVNNTYLPSYLAWSLPGLIGGFFIFRTIRKMDVKK